MDQLRHLTDLLPASFEPQAQTTPNEHLLAKYVVPGSRRRRDGRGHDAVIHDVYLIDHRLAWNPAGAPGSQQSQQELRRFSAQLMAIQDKERKRIAADLHDGIGQSLSLIKLSMESAMQLMVAGKNQQAIESMQRMVFRMKDAMAELRRATTDLHPPMLDDLGIIPTMTWFLREFEAACPGKNIEREIGVAEKDVPAALKATIFRILQEAMNNILKHANADRIAVLLHNPGTSIQLAVEDNGCGFDPASMTGSRGRGTGFGLMSMKERALSSHGVFELQSSPGQGTRIIVTWPVNGHAGHAPNTRGGK